MTTEHFDPTSCPFLATDTTPIADVDMSELDNGFVERITEFVQSLPDLIGAVRNATLKGDQNRVCEMIHQLRYSAGRYGFQKLNDIVVSAKTIIDVEPLSSVKTQSAIAIVVRACARTQLSDSEFAYEAK